MPRFFVDQPLIAGTELSLPDAVVRHVQVLRLNAGDALTVFNGSPPDLEYPARILAVGKREVRVQLDAALAVSRELPLRLGLAQGISSGERMDFTLQKGVEMGVNVFQPLATQRSIVRLSGERADKRLARWRDIILSACEQCGRNTVPELRPILSLDAWLAESANLPEARLMLSPLGSARLAELPAPTAAWLLAGPEGGLSDAEEQAALRAGWTALKLGPRILRTETAALAAVAAMQQRWGDY